MKTVVSTKGQIVLPAELRREDGIEPGQVFEVDRIDSGEYRLRRLTKKPNAGLVDLLLACPAKGWFAPSARTQTTDHVPGVFGE